MDLLLHWSVGFILGSAILLPFIFGRWIYDYDSQSWTQVCWGPVVNSITARKLKIKISEVASKEIYPITSSRFIIYHSIIANVCGILALVPDIGFLWGNSSFDRGIISNIFFFHATIDKLPADFAESISIYIFIATIIFWLIIVALAVNAQIDKDCRENFVY